MIRRTGTAKDRARRIEQGYFARRHVFRHWKLVLSVTVPIVAVIWIAWLSAAGSRTPYSAGPVTVSHAAFGTKCEVCHSTATPAMRAHVTTEACLACHDAPAHKANQTSTPACASCHTDHRGPVRLAAVEDDQCVQCHGRLTTTDGRHAVATAVGRFASRHPEFAARREGRTDTTALKFNHQVHLKPDLLGPSGPTRLTCTGCHDTNAPVAPGANGLRTAVNSGLMAPVSYSQHCANCHPLVFDRLIDKNAPHDKPDVVRTAVAASLRAFIDAHPDQVGRPDLVRGRIPINFPPEGPTMARTRDEWVAQRADAAERFLWGTACVECHTVDRRSVTTGAAASLPVYAATSAPKVWLPRAQFDHRSHQLATCQSCHAAEKSRDTSDVLVPGIATCQQCHKPEGAESRCFECHRYHDWTRAQRRPGAFDLGRLTGG